MAPCSGLHLQAPGVLAQWHAAFEGVQQRGHAVLVGIARVRARATFKDVDTEALLAAAEADGAAR